MRTATSFSGGILVACGGTGGHLFPGAAIAEAFLQRGYPAALVISEKEVDQEAARGVAGVEILTVPGAPLVRGRVGQFARGFGESFRRTWRWIGERRPVAVLSMGGFSSAPVAVAGKVRGIPLYLHEANAFPGRANRLLAPLANRVFVGFEAAVSFLCNQNVEWTGTPVRAQFQPSDGAAQRMALGFDAERPLALIMGGSQGAAGVNELILGALPLFRTAPEWQFLHLTGPADVERARALYAREGMKALVKPFLTEMELALAAATVAVCRAGASSLAEIAAMRAPSILIPYPRAADDHQRRNAQVFTRAGAAWMLDQQETTPSQLFEKIRAIGNDIKARDLMKSALDRIRIEDAAAVIAGRIAEECRGAPDGSGAGVRGPADAGAARRVRLLETAREEFAAGRMNRMQRVVG